MAKAEKQKICPICNKKLTFLKETLKDEVKVCANHVAIGAALYDKEEIKNSSVEDIKRKIEIMVTNQKESEKEIDNFVVSKRINNFVAFDEENKQWAPLSLFRAKIKKIYNYDDIVSFELLEDGSSVASGGLGRALVGGVIFGGAGAIVGGVTGRKKSKNICESLKLKVTVNDMNNPVIYINFIESKTKKNGIIYKAAANAAQESLSVFQLICDNREKESAQPVNDVTDEILKYKNLLDVGAITQEEYEIKKKELLKL